MRSSSFFRRIAAAFGVAVVSASSLGQPAPAASSPRPAAATAGSLSGSATQKTGAAPADCPERRKGYLESQACFERYRTVDGAVKAEGFKRCKEVVDPSPECGPNLPTR